ncbi:MAG TPA: dihydrofolate reductase family protein [Cellulomonas sp.]
MATLRYSAITSLDGFVADRDGRFDWGVPDEEVHARINDLQRDVRTYLYGRRLYDVMVAWETWDTTDEPEVVQDYARLWRAADKIVWSRTLVAPRSTRTRIVPALDLDEVRTLLAQADHPVLVGGAHLAGALLRAGLVTDIDLFVTPVLVGGGTRALPRDVRTDLDLVGVRRFAGGVVHLQHRVVAPRT